MTSRKRIEKEWDNAADSWIEFVRNAKDYFRDELNNPATFQLIGNVKNLKVLDVACGEGYNTRQLAGKGAKVTGIDLSRKLIASAILQEEKAPQGIDYFVLDSSSLSRFAAESFDLVTCFMALMDIQDLPGTIGEIARAMKNDGRFVFSITHPCFEYNSDNQELERTEKYFENRTDKIQWNMKRLLKPFQTTSFHRSLTDYSDTLNKHGLLIRRIVEPKPTRKGLKKFPPLKRILLTPHSIVMEVVKDTHTDAERARNCNKYAEPISVGSSRPFVKENRLLNLI